MLVPPGCAVRLIDLPCSVNAMVAVDEEGYANIYLNARHSFEKQRKSLRHELEHLERGDMYSDASIRQVEGASTLQPLIRARDLPPPKPRMTQAVARDMLTLNRLGLLTRPDPLLNLPDYNIWGD